MIKLVLIWYQRHVFRLCAGGTFLFDFVDVFHDRRRQDSRCPQFSCQVLLYSGIGCSSIFSALNAGSISLAGELSPLGGPAPSLNRHFPDKPQVRGNRTSIQPPRERHSLGSHLMARRFRFDRFRKSIRPIFSSCRHALPVVLTCRRCPRPTLACSGNVRNHGNIHGFLTRDEITPLLAKQS